MRIIHLTVTIILRLFCLLALGGAAVAQENVAASKTGLAAHRAIYEMTLDEARPGSGVAAILGYMLFDFTGSECEGFSLDMSLVNSVANLKGDIVLMDLRTKSWEQGDGGRFRFSTKHYQNRQLVDATTGDASRDAGRLSVSVELDGEKASAVKFPGKILFPTQHSLHLIEAAREGESMLQADVYDGSEKGDKFFATTAFIGKQIAPGKGKAFPRLKNAERLDSLMSWPVSVSYFDPDEEGDAVPDYELSFTLYSNGVSRGLVIDYGDYAVYGELVGIEFLNSRPCN